MSARVLLGVVCLVAGVLLAAWSLASGHVLLALAGFAMIFVFLYLAMEAMAKVGKPANSIKPAADAAWSMKNEPPGGNQNEGRR
jgi:Na+-transporting methylmalonyl-CoA/oxaloacetate decarboxylase gamma subunit